MKNADLNDALLDALTLLSNEIECVSDPDLKEDYFRVINKIEKALEGWENNG